MAPPPPFHLRTVLKPVFTQTPAQSKNPFVRSVDAYSTLLWVGSNEGRVKGYDLRPSPKPASPSTTVDDQDGSIEACCIQDTHIFPLSDTAPRPKAVEKILLLPIVSMAVILSGTKKPLSFTLVDTGTQKITRSSRVFLRHFYQRVL